MRSLLTPYLLGALVVAVASLPHERDLKTRITAATLWPFVVPVSWAVVIFDLEAEDQEGDQ